MTDFKPAVSRCKRKSEVTAPILHSRCKPVSMELSPLGLSTQLLTMAADFQGGLTGFHCSRTFKAAASSRRSCTNCSSKLLSGSVWV